MVAPRLCFNAVPTLLDSKRTCSGYTEASSFSQMALTTLSRQPGYPAKMLRIRGFASPSYDGFAFFAPVRLTLNFRG
jgi:hypothetical protein